MIHYWDTSGLVKLVVAEEGSAAAREILVQAQHSVTCRIAYVEALSAIARATREKRLSPRDGANAKVLFRALWADLMLMEIDQALLESAADLAERHGLRGYDATHLAAAADWLRYKEASVCFVTWDTRLAEAARHEELIVSAQP